MPSPPRSAFPIIIRPSFTLGGTGSGVAYNREELAEIAKGGLDASLIHEIMLEQSALGWKEYELEVMRDRADNVVIICSIENVDPMGVHTGESITVAPAQTLTDVEYQRMRDAAIAIMREIGVETGGSNVQFAIHPDTGEMIVIEMNPRVSRSSALASKATGFPIAKIAAKLAVGYTLDEIPNDITRETMASFEPTIDYCVVKIPRWTFEKFPETEDFLTTSMKSVGETMAIGRTFREALQKAIRSLEIKRFGLMIDLPPAPSGADSAGRLREFLATKLTRPNSLRLFYIAAAFRHGMSLEEIQRLTWIDPWFLNQIRSLVEAEEEIQKTPYSTEILYEAKRLGFSDRYLGGLWNLSEEEIRRRRYAAGIVPVYKLVDTCAAEFEAYTPYYYSTYETEDETRPSTKPKVVILGGGPNRIGQGIEFDYCCVHASFALREEGYESIMVNSNPETVSTDYDTSDKLFFEPVTLEDVLHILKAEKPMGVIVQFGGQTPLNLARGLEAAGAPILGTSPDAIDRAEDRKRFQEIVNRLELRQPDNDTAMDTEEAIRVAERIGYPVLVRPSYVLGGRSMEIIYETESLRRFMVRALEVSPGHPILIDKFLEDAIEVDVDAISDGKTTVVAGIMEHIEEAGIHSGDSACVPAADQLLRGTPGDDRAPDETDRRGARCRGADEHPVRDQGRRPLRPGGQSPRLADHSLCQQGDRRSSGEAGDEGHAGKNPAGTGLHETRPAEAHLGQGGGLSLQPLPQRRYPARSRDEIDGRGDGDRPFLRSGLREIADGRGIQDAAVGKGLSERPRRLQGPDRPRGRGLCPDGVSDRRDRRDGRKASRTRDHGRDDPQGQRGKTQRGRSHQERRHPTRHQRQSGTALIPERRLPHSQRCADLQCPLYDDDLRRPGAGGGDRRPAEGAVGCDAAAGLPPESVLKMRLLGCHSS